MSIRPIKNEHDCQAALAEIEFLFGAAVGTPEGDRLEVLTTLVEVFEEKQYHIPLPDPIAAIQYYVESRGLSPRDLEQYLGNSEIASEVLDRRRALSNDMIRRLHAGLGISADVLIQPYSLAA